MLKVKDVATRLNVSTRTVQVWVDTGKLPAFKLGGVIRIAPDALDAFIMNACPTAKKTPPTGGSATPTPPADALERLLGPPTTRKPKRKNKRSAPRPTPTVSDPPAA